MAGKKVYVGKMLESLQADMASMVASQQAVVDQLIEVKANVLTTVDKLLIIADNGIRLNFNNVTASVDSDYQEVEKSVKIDTVKSACDGTLRIFYDLTMIHTISGSGTQGACYIAVSFDGGTTKKGGAGLSDAGSGSYSMDIPVAKDDMITIYLCVTGGTNTKNRGTLEANSLKFAYKVTNIVDQGGFIIQP